MALRHIGRLHRIGVIHRHVGMQDRQQPALHPSLLGLHQAGSGGSDLGGGQRHKTLSATEFVSVPIPLAITSTTPPGFSQIERIGKPTQQIPHPHRQTRAFCNLHQQPRRQGAEFSRFQPPRSARLRYEPNGLPGVHCFNKGDLLGAGLNRIISPTRA